MDSHHENHKEATKETQGKRRDSEHSGRAKLKHVLLDVDLPNHNRIIPLKKRFGVTGKCALYEIYMAMSKATDAVIDKELIICIAEDNGVTDAEDYHNYLVEKKLIRPEMDGFSNEPVIKDQESYFRKLNSGQKKKISEQKCSAPEQKSPEPDIDTDSDTDIDIDIIDPKENGAPPQVELPPDSKFLEAAREALEPADSLRLQRDNRYILAGRRPMRKFPMIWLTEHELCDVLETYEKWGIPVDGRQIHLQAFKNVSSDLVTRQAENKSTKINAYTWLIGHEAQRLLDSLIKQTRLKREELYTEKARA